MSPRRRVAEARRGVRRCGQTRRTDWNDVTVYCDMHSSVVCYGNIERRITWKLFMRALRRTYVRTSMYSISSFEKSVSPFRAVCVRLVPVYAMLKYT